MTEPEPRASLAATPRWSALASFVARWYERPIEPEDGLDDASLDAIETRLDRPLPPHVREWFALLGRRLQATNQDQPVLPDQLELRDGRLALWWENQGNWSLDVELDGDQSVASVFGETFGEARRAHVCDALAGMVLGDTMVAAWSRGPAPLGTLSEAVAGGCCLSGHAAVDVDVHRLPRLAPSMSPHYAEQYGRAAFVVRGFEGDWQWMSADAESFAQACEIFRVDPVGGVRHLELRFASVPPSVRAFLQAVVNGSLEHQLGARVRTAQHDRAFSRATIELETHEPVVVLTRVIERMDDAARAALHAEHRPPHVSRGVPIWPA